MEGTEEALWSFTGSQLLCICFICLFSFQFPEGLANILFVLFRFLPALYPADRLGSKITGFGLSCELCAWRAGQCGHSEESLGDWDTGETR